MALDPSSGPYKAPSSITTFEPVAPDALVSFTVLCTPASGIAVNEFREKLASSDTRALRPTGKTLGTVTTRLRELGFEVFDRLVFPNDRPGLAVFARGSVARFEEVFHTRLAIMIRRSVDDEIDRSRTTSGIVVADRAPAPSVKALGSEVLLVSVAEPPSLAAPVGLAAATASSASACLSLLDVARQTHATDVHNQPLFLRGKANGSGVRVAVIDSGFAHHSFFDAYRVTRLSGPYQDGTGGPGDEHGTIVLSNLLICAPGVDVYAVKYFSQVDAFVTAMQIPDVRVISLSWGLPIGSDPTPDTALPLEYFVKAAVREMGITVVAATGFLERESTPARLHEVISVGGAIVESPTTQSAWGGTAAFTSTVYGTRDVPDLCGVASQINMPVAASHTAMACGVGSTSCATPQVAAVAALLIQKNPTLTPSQVRNSLMSFATDITTGHAYPNVPAGRGPDKATGAGFVNALASWSHVADAWWTMLWPWS